MKVWVDRHTFPITVSGWSLLWALGLLLGLALLDKSMHEVLIFLVPPFAAIWSALKIDGLAVHSTVKFGTDYFSRFPVSCRERSLDGDIR